MATIKKIENCIICAVEIKNTEVFGSWGMPACRACNGRFAAQLYKIERTTNVGTARRNRKINALREKSRMTPEVVEIEQKKDELSDEKKDLQREIESLEDQVHYIDREIRELDALLAGKK